MNKNDLIKQLNNDNFQEKLLELDRNPNMFSIYMERDTHALIKNMLSDNEHQEIKIGSYICDVGLECDNKIELFEVQTISYAPLRQKLKDLCVNYDVTLVTPLFNHKTLYWLKDNELSQGHTSPIHENIWSYFKRLYQIRMIINDNTLNKHLHFLLLNFDGMVIKKELKRTYKRRGEKIVTEPVKLNSVIYLDSIKDYKDYLPDSDIITSLSLSKECHVSRSEAQKALLMLWEAGVLERINDKAPYEYKLL